MSHADDRTDTSQTPGADRRTVLRGAAVVGLAGTAAVALAGCSGSPSADDTSTGSPTGAGGDKPTGSIVKTSDVPVGGGKVVNASGTKVVVTQPTEGTFVAFSAVCTHQGCTVNSIENDVIRCPCHGSEFNGTTGAVVDGPATAPLASIPVAVADGTVSFA